jgi:2-amino-4-hydroxy-6-hydroxymethyldihydropteridine diphosphokinase
LQDAVWRLGELGEVEAVSPVFETEPVGYADQPAFLNAVARLRTALAPVPLVERLLRIEHDFGRTRSFPNAPRPLDLDLLFHEAGPSTDPRAIVPHPRLHQRRFVLAPLAAIAPGVVHPVLQRSVAELLVELDDPAAVTEMPALLLPRPGVTPDATATGPGHG